jgi:hypothetical protein
VAVSVHRECPHNKNILRAMIVVNLFTMMRVGLENMEISCLFTTVYLFSVLIGGHGVMCFVAFSEFTEPT